MEKAVIGDVCSHSTSVVKAFTWRAIATTTTTILVLWRSGHVALAVEVGHKNITPMKSINAPPRIKSPWRFLVFACIYPPIKSFFNFIVIN